MSKKIYPTDVLEQAQSVFAIWNQIDASLTFGAQTTDVRNQCDASLLELRDTVKRVRNRGKATYGDDSPEYEMIGGTRVSERKTPVRKTKA